MSDLQDKWDYDREAVYIESGHGEVTTGAMRYAHRHMAELEAEVATLRQVLESFTSNSSVQTSHPSECQEAENVLKEQGHE